MDALDSAYQAAQSVPTAPSTNAAQIDPLNAAYFAPPQGSSYNDKIPNDPQGRTYGQAASSAGNSDIIHGIGNLLYGGAKGAADLVQAPAQGAINLAALTGNDYMKNKASAYNQYLANQERQYQDDTNGSIAAGVGRFGTSIAPFLLSGGATSAASAPAAVDGAISVPAAVSGFRAALNTAGQGAGYGLMQPDTSNPSDPWAYLKDKAGQAAIGAGTNLAMSVPSTLISKALSPQISDDARLLMKNGVNLTPGQILGGGWQSTENKATSIPLIGDMIKNAQRRSMGDFNVAALNKAAPIDPVTEKIIPTFTSGGQNGVAQAQDYFNNGYGNILGQMTHMPDKQFEQDVMDAYAKNRVGLNGISEFDGMLGQHYTPKFVNNENNVPVMSGDDIKAFQTQLRQSANSFNKSQDPIDQRVGDAYGDISQAFKNSLARQNDPALVGQLNDLDKQYAAFKQYQNASLMGAASKREGMITPADYLSTMRSNAKSTGNTGTYSAGTGMNQDFGNAAQNVLGNTYPDSGTVGRAGLIGLAGLAPTAYTHPLIAAGTAIAGGAATLPYTELGQKAAQAVLAAPRPLAFKPIADAIDKYGPIIGTAMNRNLVAGH